MFIGRGMNSPVSFFERVKAEFQFQDSQPDVHFLRNDSSLNEPEEVFCGREWNGHVFGRAVSGDGIDGIGPIACLGQSRRLLQDESFKGRRRRP